jgi:hypothetical protein
MHVRVRNRSGNPLLVLIHETTPIEARVHRHAAAYGCLGRRSPRERFHARPSHKPGAPENVCSGAPTRPNVPRRIVRGDRSEGASGPPDAPISEGEWTRCRVAPTALVCATASRESASDPSWSIGPKAPAQHAVSRPISVDYSGARRAREKLAKPTVARAC